MKKISILWALFFSGAVIAATPLKNIVIFGDSLSDNGNFYRQLEEHHITPFPESPPYYKGRFSNGPVWNELLAKSWYPENPDAHLRNYACGGAEVAPNKVKANFLTLQNQIKNQYLMEHSDKASKDSLYVIWIGANNYLQRDTDQEVKTVINGIDNGINTLIKAGAKHILVLNLPDLGETPLAHLTDSEGLKNEELPQRLSSVCKRHNEELANLVSQLRSTWPEVQLLTYDVNLVVNDILSEPAKYHFTDTEGFCYHPEGTDAESASATATDPVLNMVAGIHAKLEVDCTGYLFFDPLHPVGAAHELMAKRAREFLEANGIEFVS